MGTYKLTPDDAFIDPNPSGGIYFAGTSGTNSMTVEAGTLLYCLDTDVNVWNTPLEFGSSGRWTVNFNGSAWSTATTGIFFDAGVPGSKTSTITIGAEGSVYGQYAGLNFGGYGGDDNPGPFTSAPVVVMIIGEVGASYDDTTQGAALYFNTTGAHTVVNTGRIYGYWGLVSEGVANDTITNSGQMDWVAAGAGTNILTNTSQLQGYFGGWGVDNFSNNGSNAYVGADVELGDGANTLKNSGTINFYNLGQPGVLGGDDADTVTNSGVIEGGVNLSDGSNTLNSTAGRIGATDNVSYTGYDGSDSVTNGAQSRLDGSVHVGNGTNKLANAGFIGADADGYSYTAGYSAQPGAGYHNDTVTNTGASAQLLGAVKLGDGTNSLTNSGSIGAVSGTSVEGGLQNDSVVNSGILAGGVKLGDGTNSLTNSGQVGGDVSAGSGVDTLVNTAAGTLINVDLGSGSNKVSNSGLIAMLVTGSGADTITNAVTGRISTSVSLGGTSLAGSTDSLTNKGVIGVAGSVSVLGDLGTETLVNSGSILGEVSLGDGTNRITNSGAIGENGQLAILGGAGVDIVTSTRAILGGIDLGDGANTLVNSGAIGEDTHNLSYTGGAHTDIVTNSGTMIGDVWLGGGADTFTDYSGKVQGTVYGLIDLGAGADKFLGGNNAEWVIDNDGADTYSLGGGDDGFTAVGASDDGVDTVDGGAGIDTYDASGAIAAVRVNLSTATQVDPFASITLDAARTTGSEIGTDLLKNLENVFGGSGSDIIFGTDGTTAANLLMGNDGDDHLAGLGGSDTLIGGAGSDGLFGGAGKDYLTGGDGTGPDGTADYFVYTRLSDSGVTASTRDVITDFELGIDKVMLSDIDANTGHAGDDAFTFIGTNVAFSHTAGELRAYWTVSGQIVEGDVNGDGRADFSIEFQGLHAGDIFQASDFIL